jgi:dihydrolipoamide dehydrogenase
MPKKIVVIGGGPGGYTAALRARQLGADVLLVEADRDGGLGGVPVKQGGIPIKTLLHTIGLFQEVRERGRDIGLKAEGLEVDWEGLMAHKNRTTRDFSARIEELLRAKGVEIRWGRARLIGPTETEIELKDGKKERIKAYAVIAATGASPAVPELPGLGLPGVITSEMALSLPKPPKSLLIIGGGVIAVEMAAIFLPLGTRVTVLESLPGIILNVDQEIANLMRGYLEKAGCVIRTGVSVKGISQDKNGLRVDYEDGGPLSETAETVLVASGRKANLDALDAAGLGLELDKGKVKTGPTTATNLPGLHAVGDLASPVTLAHLAARQGEVAAESIMGLDSRTDLRRLPGAIYTNPEIAWVGLTEAQAKDAGHKVKVGRFPLAHSGMSRIMGGEGLFKVVVGEQTGELLGAQLIGPRATDIIGEATLALRVGAGATDLVAALRASPSVSEALGEAAMDALGRSLSKF